MKAARLVYPNRCCVCDEVQTSPGTLCEACAPLRLYPAQPGARCAVCGVPNKRCVCCEDALFTTLTFPFYYEGRVRQALHRMKFRGRTDLFLPFAREMAAALAARDLRRTDFDCVCFVPMRGADRRKRGYNQAEELAKSLGKALDLPVLPLLEKTAKTGQQHDLPQRLRRGNILGAFEINHQLLSHIEGRRLLLVDDIHTSGSTLNEAAKTLLIFGAARVDCLCAAATPAVGSAGAANAK